jgi:hypothetical protein
MNIRDRTSVQVQRIKAIGLTVIDIDRAQDFYTQALLFKPVSDITCNSQIVQVLTVKDALVKDPDGHAMLLISA